MSIFPPAVSEAASRMGYCIVLSSGQITQIDKEDAKKISKYHWYSVYSPGMRSYYAASERKRRGLLMHRLITNAPKDRVVDHINRDTLDNRRNNLRVCTHQENSCNRKLYTNSTTGFKGVTKTGYKIGSWKARITKEGKRIELGSFRTPLEAARAYNDAAVKFHGEFALLNNI